MVRITPSYKPWSSPIWKGNNPILRELMITMVMNHLLTGMILQAERDIKGRLKALRT